MRFGNGFGFSSGGILTRIPLLSQGYRNPAITYTRADGVKSYFNQVGTLLLAGVNVWPDEFDGVSHAYLGPSVWQRSTNFALNSASAATQSVTLAVGTYTLWCIGTGSVVSAAGTAVGTGFGASTGSSFGSRPVPIGGSNTFTITTAGTVTLTVTAPLTYMVCESSAFPTPYIPTTSAAVTRNMDSTPFLISALPGANTAGTFIITGQYTNLANAGNLIVIDDGTGANRVQIGIDESSGGIQPFCYNGGVSSGLSETSNVTSINTNFICGISWGASYALCLNGGTVQTAAVASPSTMTGGSVGNNFINTTPFNGNISSLVYYPYAMTAAQLQAITA